MVVERSGRGDTQIAEKKERKPAVRMVPLFSWRTVIAVSVGLIMGAGLGLGYWLISPWLGS